MTQAAARDATAATGEVLVDEKEIRARLRDAAIDGDYEYIEKVALAVLAQAPDTPWAIHYVVVGACGARDAAVARKWAPKLSPQTRKDLAKVPCGDNNIDIE